jgi:restriction endonuclease S subunit
MECFVIYSNDIEGRTDPHFYKPDFRVLTNRLKKLTYKPLGELVKFSDETWNQKDFFDKTFPYIEISEIDIITGEIKNVVYNNKNEAPSRAKMIVRQDDIIVSTTRPNRGAIALIDKVKDGFIASTGFAILRGLKTADVNRAYLFYTLRTNLILNQMLQRSSGGNYPAITSDELNKINIPLPSLKTQTRIVSIMQSAYGQKKQKEHEAQKLLDSIYDYMLDELGIKLPGTQNESTFVINSNEIEGRLDPIFYNSTVKTIKNIIKKMFGKHHFGEVIFDIYRYPTFYGFGYQTSGIPVIKGENINKNGNIAHNQDFDYISKEIHNNYPRTQLKKGDLIFTVRGLIGKVGFFNGFVSEANINANVIKITIKGSNSPEFFWIFLNSPIGQCLIQTLTSGQVQKTITVPDIKNIQIPLPSLSVQNKIAEEIKKRMAKAEKLKSEAEDVLAQAKEEVENIILGKK